MKPQRKTPEATNINLPNKDIATTQQINTLLGIMSMTMSALSRFDDIEYESEGEGVDRLDGESKVAAQTTFIKTCYALDAILDDKSRWSNDFQNQIEKNFERLHEKQIEFLDAQQRASEELLTPHFRFKPNLSKMKDGGGWVVHLGDASQIEHSIFGVGRTPEEAIAAFDAAFVGEPMSVELYNWLIKREQDLEAGNKLEPFPNEQINDSTVDPGTGPTTPPAEDGGDTLSEDSGETGPNS